MARSRSERALPFKPHENLPDEASIGALAFPSSAVERDVYHGSRCGSHHDGCGRHKPANPVRAVKVVDVHAVWILFVVIEENGSRKGSRHGGYPTAGPGVLGIKLTHYGRSGPAVLSSYGGVHYGVTRS
jgi:hypothetical protein